MFFIISFIILVFFWFYEICFCGVYVNTQLHLIKDSVISFGLSLVYPFSIYFTPSSTTIGPGSNITFDINIVWPYEDNTKYYKLNEVYEYDRAFKYFNLVGTNYVERSILDQTSYENNLDDLFLGKDDADTYFGMMCHQYEQTSGLPCLTMTMTLKAEQRIS